MPPELTVLYVYGQIDQVRSLWSPQEARDWRFKQGRRLAGGQVEQMQRRREQ